ncbi:diguanylate cyclase (GGDEF)-like protein [Amorphus suaedae]
MRLLAWGHPITEAQPSSVSTSVFDREGFAQAVLDALTAQICVVDAGGVIIAVNRAWTRFLVENSPPCETGEDWPGMGVGAPYVRICQDAYGPDSEEADDFGRGLLSVLNGEVDGFELEYPCHSPTEERWFLGRVKPLPGHHRGAVISHNDVTAKKRSELELERLASTDALTGLPNLRMFMDVAGRELKRIRRYGGQAAIAMIDLDHFKQVNDRYGHPAGDDALRAFTAACGDILRETDLLARVGGEEFAAILPRVDQLEALAILERMRLAVQETVVVSGGRSIDITASFGLSEMLSQDLVVEESMARADAALMMAKRSGRNQVRRLALPRPLAAD